MIFFFSDEMITVVVFLVVGDDMQYKPRLHAFIQQILMELSLCTSDYSRHLDYFKKKKKKMTDQNSCFCRRERENIHIQ